GLRVDQLCGDPHALRSAADGAFEHRPHTKLAADGADVDRAALVSEARVARDYRQAGNLRQVGDDVFGDAVGEIFLLGIAGHVGEWQNGDRRRRAVRLRFGGIGFGGGEGCRAGMPLPDTDRPVDILDADLAAVLEANVDPIADALIDDRGDTDTARFGQRLQARGDVDAIAVNVVAFHDYIAKIEPDPQNNLRLAQGFIRQGAVGALHGKRAVHGIDHASELRDGAVADQLHDAAVVGSNRRIENHF